MIDLSVLSNLLVRHEENEWSSFAKKFLIVKRAVYV